MNLRHFLIGVLTLIAAIVVGGRIMQRQEDATSPIESAVAEEPLTRPPSRSEVTAVQEVRPRTSAGPGEAEAAVTAGSPPPLDLVLGPAAWDEPVNRVIRLERDAALRAKGLLAMLPKMPEEALAEITEKAVDQLPDAAYSATAGPLVTNPDTAGQVMSVLFADLMERPDAITLPALLQIARTPQHPFSASAFDNLKLLLRVDRGSDWGAWQRDVQRVLDKGQ